MDVIKTLLTATSHQLINYAGCIYLNQLSNTKALEVEYNKTMQLLQINVGTHH